MEVVFDVIGWLLIAFGLMAVALWRWPQLNAGSEAATPAQLIGVGLTSIAIGAAAVFVPGSESQSEPVRNAAVTTAEPSAESTPASTATPDMTSTPTATVAPTRTATATPTRTSTATPSPSPDPDQDSEGTPISRRFFFATDDDAIALDAAVERVLEGDRAARDTVRSIRRRVLARVNRHLLNGGDTSVGANLILSAATEAVRATDDRDLVRARGYIVEGRTELADEIAR